MAMHHKSIAHAYRNPRKSAAPQIRPAPPAADRSGMAAAGARGHHVEVIEIGEVENLQVETLGAGVLPPLHRRCGLVDGAGDASFSELRRWPVNRLCPTSELVLVSADDGLQC